MTGQLDKAKEIAALTATVTVKEIFAGVDIERRASFRMKGTESDELGAVSGGPGGPMLLPQIIEQRKALFQFFDVLAQGAVLPLEAKVGEGGEYSQARMVGGEIFSATQGPENLQNRSQPRQRSSLVIGLIAVSPPVSHTSERLAETGWERSRPLDQRRSVEESGTRLGSLSVGVASSQEQCSTKRRRNA
jgi:hypothetical protein